MFDGRKTVLLFQQDTAFLFISAKNIMPVFWWTACIVLCDFFPQFPINCLWIDGNENVSEEISLGISMKIA